MNRLTPLLLLVCCLAGCTTWHDAPLTAGKPRSGEFLQQISYPYQASRERREWIERAALELPVGATEAEVFAVLGKPDYAAGVASWNKRTGEKIVHSEVWHYVHSLDRYIEPDYHGKMLIITLSNRTNPRVAIWVEPYGLGERKLPRVLASYYARQSKAKP